MKAWRWIFVGILVLSLDVGLGVAADDGQNTRDVKIAPRFKVDPSWPKPLAGQLGYRTDRRNRGRFA
jgi:hypothetical protein